MVAAIRQDIIAELDAINLYEAHKAATKDKGLKDVLQHIIDEEKEHAEELRAYLDKVEEAKKEVKKSVEKYIDEALLEKGGFNNKVTRALTGAAIIGGLATGAGGAVHAAKNMAQIKNWGGNGKKIEQKDAKHAQKAKGGLEAMVAGLGAAAAARKFGPRKKKKVAVS